MHAFPCKAWCWRHLGWVLCVTAVGGSWTACATGREHGNDDALAQAVKHALYDQDAVNLLQVEITVDDGVVYLDGEVEEVNRKLEAELAAISVDGVGRVVNKLQLLP